MEKTEIFIDAEYVLQSIRNLQDAPRGAKFTKSEFDWRKFITYILNSRELSKVNYYTARMDINEDINTYRDQDRYLKELKTLLADYHINLRLGRMSKTTQKTSAKWGDDDGNGVITWVQKGIDTKIVWDMCELVYNNYGNVTTALLVAGDEDFTDAIQKLNGLKIKTELVSFYRTGDTNSKALGAAAKTRKVLGYKDLSAHGIL